MREHTSDTAAGRRPDEWQSSGGVRLANGGGTGTIAGKIKGDANKSGNGASAGTGASSGSGADALNLNLKGMGLSAADMTVLCEAVKGDGNGNLTALDLRSNRLTVEAVRPLAAAIASNGTLRTLLLSGGLLGASGQDRGVGILCDGLRANGALQRLDLAGCAVSPLGAAPLADALSSNRALTALDLQDNALGADGVTMLADALLGNAGNAALASLNLSERLGVAGAALVASVLKRSTTLTEDLGDRRRGRRCCAACRRTHLESIRGELCLWGNDLGVRAWA